MNRLRSLLRLLLSLLVFRCGSGAVAEETLPPRTLRVLFIGNSYTYGNDLPGLISQLLPARGSRLEHESVTPGGASLEKQWADGKALLAIRKQQWDFVVLQEQSVRPFKDREAMFSAARLLHAEIAKTGAKTLLYETWAAKASPDEQSKLTDAYETLGRELGAAVVPAGAAWEKAIAAGFELHGSDGRHPNRRGSYLAACLFVRPLTGESPIGLPNEGTTEGKPWTVAEAPALQRIAAETPVPAGAAAPGASAWEKLPPHPRLFANAARFAAVKAQDDVVSRQLAALLQHDAEEKLAAAKIVYPTTGFKFGAVREVQGRILTLALSYRLGGDPRFLARARQELLELAALPDWCPTHFLDVGEAALAAAIGLDWLYDELTPVERDQVAQSIVKNALVPSLAAEEGKAGWVDGDFNWNQVCHGGLVAGAFAVAEREPELAQRIVTRAIKLVPKAGAAYAPDGSYPEGPNYWSYGTTFHVLVVEALRSALGSSFDLEKAPGFLQTADFMEQVVAPSGADFNFSDYHERPNSEPVLLWFARELGRRSAARQELDNLTAMHAALVAGKTDAIRHTRHLGFELLWWNPALPTDDAFVLPLHWTARGVTPVAVMRSAWKDPRAAYLGVKGGSPDHSHGHMDAGSFVLEADGVRWALDLGAESYDKMRAAKLTLWSYAQESTRWSTFRVGSEGHNILRFDGEQQQVDGKAEVSALPDANGSVGNLVELTPLYRNQISRVQRRVRLHADRSVSIDDGWTTGAKATRATWQWLTRAQVTVTPDGAILRQSGETLRLRIAEGAGAEVEVEDVSQPRNAWDSPNPGLSRILIHLHTPPETTAHLRVTATPGAGS